MTRMRVMRRIILPQAIRVVIPTTGNQLIGLLKYTSLVSVLAVPDLLYSAELVYQQNYKVIPLLLVASIWYLAITSVLMIGQYYLERHFSRGSVRTRPLTPAQRIRAALIRRAPRVEEPA
jgi:polar amino acid transport system permease protein